MPTNSAVREMLPPKRLTWARQILALEDLAGVAERQRHQMLAPCPARRRRQHLADLGGQHLGGDRLAGVAARQDHQPLDVVAELADVARPVMRLEHRHGVVADGPRAAGRSTAKSARRSGGPVSGMSSRRSASAGTRIGTTASRWNRSSRNVPSAISRSRSRAGRRDDAHVDSDPRRRRRRAGRSGRPARAGSCSASRAACRRLRRDRACRHAPPRARRRAAPAPLIGLGAEQLLLHAFRRDRGGIEHHERPRRTLRQLVDGAGDRFLAGRPTAPEIMIRLLVGATFSIDLAQVVHRRRGADQLGRLAAPFAQHLDLAAELRGLQRPLGDQHQAIGLERLLDVVVGAALDRRDRGLDIAVAGDHDHRQVGIVALDRVEQRPARRSGCPAARCRGRPATAGASRSRRARHRRRPRFACRGLRRRGSRTRSPGYRFRRRR